MSEHVTPQEASLLSEFVDVSQYVDAAEVPLLTRRKFLFMGGAVGLAALLGGCRLPRVEGNVGYEFATCTGDVDRPFVYRNSDPVFRAASVPVFSQVGYGHGSLLKDSRGNLRVVTVRHVARMAKGLCTYAAVPGSGVKGALDWRKRQEWGHRVVDVVNNGLGNLVRSVDDIVSLEMTRGHEQHVRQFMREGGVVPLQRYEGELQEDDWVGIPNPETGKMGYFQIVELEGHKIVMESKAGSVCQGRSGGPVLRWDGSRKSCTNEMVGAAYMITVANTDSSGRACGDERVYAIRV